MMNKSDELGMKEIFDFDPHEGPNSYESQDEFDQRIEIRILHWEMLQLAVMCWIQDKHIIFLDLKRKERDRLIRLQIWELLNKNFKPTSEGLAYYFSNTEQE